MVFYQEAKNEYKTKPLTTVNASQTYGLSQENMLKDIFLEEEYLECFKKCCSNDKEHDTSPSEVDGSTDISQCVELDKKKAWSDPLSPNTAVLWKWLFQKVLTWVRVRRIYAVFGMHGRTRVGGVCDVCKTAIRCWAALHADHWENVLGESYLKCDEMLLLNRLCRTCSRIIQTEFVVATQMWLNSVAYGSQKLLYNMCATRVLSFNTPQQQTCRRLAAGP